MHNFTPPPGVANPSMVLLMLYIILSLQLVGEEEGEDEPNGQNGLV